MSSPIRAALSSAAAAAVVAAAVVTVVTAPSLALADDAKTPAAKTPDAKTATVTVKPASGAATTAGATIKINGKVIGQVPLKVTLQPGRYLLEVVKDQHTDFRQWIEVKAGDARTFDVALKSTAATGGSLLVATNVVGAKIYMDGKEVDTAPTLLKNLKPGKHVIEARAPGYTPVKQAALIELGKTSKLTIKLEPDASTIAKTSGTLQVIANEKGVAVIIDGKLKGKTPLRITGLEEGTHVVEGTLDGHLPDKQTIAVKKGELKTVKLELKPKPVVPRSGSIKVTSNELGATVFVDGRFVGKTPFRRPGYAAGPHVVTVRKKGFKEHVESVDVKGGGTAALDVKLVPTNKPTDPAALVKDKTKVPDHDSMLRSMASYSARGIAPLLFAVDASVGFPYIFAARFSLGMFTKSVFRLDGGIGFRTFGAMNEVGVHLKVRFARNDLFAAAAMFDVGGGGGSKARNTISTNMGVLGSLTYGRFHATVRAFLNIYSDRLCETTPRADELAACTRPPAGVNAGDTRSRFTGLRFYLSAIAEFTLTRHIGLFALFEGVPFQPDRNAYTDPFAQAMATSDPGTYFRLGVTFKN